MTISIRNVAMMAGVTMLVMFAANQAAARSATFRRYVRGGPIAVATSNGQAV